MGFKDYPKRRTVLKTLTGASITGLGASSGILVDDTDKTTNGIKMVTAYSWGEPHIYKIVPEKWYTHLQNAEHAFKILKENVRNSDKIGSAGMRASENKIEGKNSFELVVRPVIHQEPSSIAVPDKINGISVYREEPIRSRNLSGQCGQTTWDREPLPGAGPRIDVDPDSSYGGTAGFPATAYINGNQYRVLVTARHTFADTACNLIYHDCYHDDAIIGSYWKSSEKMDYIILVSNTSDDITGITDELYTYSTDTVRSIDGYFGSNGISDLISDGDVVKKEGATTGYRECQVKERFYWENCGLWEEVLRYANPNTNPLQANGDSGGPVWEDVGGETILVGLACSGDEKTSGTICSGDAETEWTFKKGSGPAVHKIVDDAGIYV